MEITQTIRGSRTYTWRINMKSDNSFEMITIGGGCFWCVEAIFARIKGISKITSGYAGGITENPTYEEVCTEQTEHAEVVQIHFDPNKISYANLLEIFFYTHDPTTLNRQGADIGSQYRSIILYHNIEQKNIAEKYIAFLIENDIYNKKIVTELVKFNKFYPAENYHQNYYSNNQSQSYCTFVISPKLQKLYSSNFYEKYKK